MTQKIQDAARRIRNRIIRVAHHAPSNGVHVSPALPMADILSTLYGGVMHYDTQNIICRDRDVYILHGGHAALGCTPPCASSALFAKTSSTSSRLTAWR